MCEARAALDAGVAVHTERLDWLTGRRPKVLWLELAEEVWVPAVASVGLRGVGFHDLRRANATAMVLDGVDMKTAQTRSATETPA